MMRPGPYRLALLGLLVLIPVAMVSAMAATNTVPTSGTDDLIADSWIDANDLKPAQCGGMALGSIVIDGVTVRGTGSNALILGSNGADVINGGNNDDCILGGAGNDDLRGGPGSDVILGGSDIDSLDGGAPPSAPGDICYGGGDAGDTFARCETIVP